MRKENQEQKMHDKAKRQFIREQLKPQRKKMMLRIAHKCIMVFCAAVLFGGISALSFSIMRIYFPWEELDESITVAAPGNLTSDAETEDRTVSDTIEESALDSLEDCDRISREFAKVGEHANDAIVKIGDNDAVSMDGSAASDYCGILFHETTHYYYILTESAAVSGQEASVWFSEEKAVTGNLTGCSETLDIAVLRVRKAELTQTEQDDIVIAELGDTSALALGSCILAVGKPNGHVYSIGTGVLTEQMQEVSIVDQTISLYTLDLPYQQERAGFVLNIQGQLVGMITARYIAVTGEIDTGFMGLSALAEDITRLLRGETAPYMGVRGTDVSDSQAEQLNLVSGIYLDAVESGSPAYQGGMRVADVITGIDGNEIETMEQLHAYLLTCQSGQELTVTIYRQSTNDTVKKQLAVTLQ